MIPWKGKSFLLKRCFFNQTFYQNTKTFCSMAFAQRHLLKDICSKTFAQKHLLKDTCSKDVMQIERYVCEQSVFWANVYWANVF
jgi:hypothetical protein